MYDVSVPVLAHGLKSLAAVLKKAEAHCDAKKIDHAALLNFRLFPDMFPLTAQVQLACDFAKGPSARLSETPVPSFPDEEKTFAELQARIAKTLAFIEGIEKSKFNGAETRDVTVRVSRTEEKTLPGQKYFNTLALPNFYFHMTTAYSVLRHNGVELGKGDFMGRNI